MVVGAGATVVVGASSDAALAAAASASTAATDSVLLSATMGAIDTGLVISTTVDTAPVTGSTEIVVCETCSPSFISTGMVKIDRPNSFFTSNEPTVFPSADETVEAMV